MLLLLLLLVILALFGVRLLFSFQIESLRYKEQLFSLNLEGNPICDKLTDNIDFRLYIAAYLPKLKYYGYQVITNAERDKGREIYKYVYIDAPKRIPNSILSVCLLLDHIYLCVCSSEREYFFFIFLRFACMDV